MSDQVLTKNHRRFAIVGAVVCAGLLAWALLPFNPYGFYILLRIVITGYAIYLAALLWKVDQTGWLWCVIVLAAVYNPIVRVHLTREIWSVINVATIVILIMAMRTVRTSTCPASEGSNNE